MKLKNSFVIAVVSATAMVGLIACGDDDDSESSEAESTALTQDELVSQADAICAEHAKAINTAVEEAFAEGQTPVAIRGVVKDGILPQYTAQIGQLDQLEPPEDVVADWDAYLEASTVARDAIKDDPNFAFDPAGFEDVNGQAEALGLGEDCLVGPT